MYINNDEFEKWATRLSKEVSEIGKGLKSLINTNGIFNEDDQPLDNQDVSLTLNVSHRTLQRYRDSGLLPFFKIGQKVYYRTSDVRKLVFKSQQQAETKMRGGQQWKS